MHLANGTLTNDVCTITAALSTAAICYAASRATRSTTPARVVKAVIGAGIVLIAQMIDVSLFNDLRVHVIGAAFLTLLAGPALALLGMAAVVVTQALALNDGGVMTLGANVFNMAVVGVTVSALTIRLARNRLGSRTGLLIAAPLAGALSVVAATFAMTAELALSGVSLASALSLTLPAHAPFAAWEAASTFVLVMLAAYTRAIKPIPASTSSN
jgi:cobalt/nickel transport system permease protein